MDTAEQVEQRLEFCRLDGPGRIALRETAEFIDAEMPRALDVLYRQIRQFPQTRRHFADEAQIDRAANAQLRHWKAIVGGDFGEAYVNSVRAIGRTHARIGLEPRWYIGSYALVLEHLVTALIRGRWPQGMFAGRDGAAEKTAQAAAALIKAVMLDMDFVIDVYLETAEQERQASEQAAIESQRQLVVDTVGRALERMAQGEVGFRLTDGLPPEYDKLKSDFNAAMDTLQSTLSEIAVAASAIASGAAQISQSADDLSRRTEQQVASLEETAAALEQITATVQRTAEGSAQARASAAAAKETAEHSGAVVSEAVAAMGHIERSAGEIGQIIGVIDEIAFQTNLLALNAGVEAARAGDAGKGFAVVASEVRGLAQRSAEAAKEIKTLISASAEEVETGVRLVGEAGQSLGRIADQVSEVNGAIVEIAGSTTEQATGLKEVNVAVNQMDHMTQQNAAMVEQTTAASHNLAGLAERLMQLIGRFEGVHAAAGEPRRALRLAT